MQKRKIDYLHLDIALEILEVKNESDLFILARKIFDGNLNVILKENEFTLGVDTRAFQQR